MIIQVNVRQLDACNWATSSWIFTKFSVNTGDVTGVRPTPALSHTNWVANLGCFLINVAVGVITASRLCCLFGFLAVSLVLTLKRNLARIGIHMSADITLQIIQPIFKCFAISSLIGSKD